MKKKILLIFLMTTSVYLFSFAQCNDKLIDIAVSQNHNATYLKDFKVKLPATPKNKPRAIAKFQIVLNGGNHYRFNIAKASEYNGIPIIQLYEGNKLLGTSYLTSKQKDYKMFDFICQKTGTYKIFISFKDGAAGCAVGILSLVN
ncbi:MAG TPA: hypothetical protein EYP69_02665 [Bacteroidales bacterium]|nr:hypothetical protein [Bacteroidales bacterium]